MEKRMKFVQVKVFGGFDFIELENRVNVFLEDFEEVRDIKFWPEDSDGYSRFMVTYIDEDEDEAE